MKAACLIPLETIDCSTTMSLYRLTCKTKSLPMRDGHLPGSVTRKRIPNSASLLVISVFRRGWCPTPSKSYKVTQVRSPCAPSCSLGRLRPTSELASSSSPLDGADSVIVELIFLLFLSLLLLLSITTAAASWWHLSSRSPAATMKNSGVVH